MTAQPLPREMIGQVVTLGGEEFEKDNGHTLGALLTEQSTDNLLGLRSLLTETYAGDLAEVAADQINPMGHMVWWIVTVIEHEIGARWVGWSAG